MYNRLITAYLVLRAAVWSVALHVTQSSQPLDVLESLGWGREWRLVHENHPSATAWVVGALDRVGGGDSFLLSLPAPVAVSLTMAAVWLLARSVVGEKRAVVSVLALEGVYYFTVVAAEFNHNILLMAAWAWVVLLAHRAFFAPEDKHNIGRWIALGVLCAFSLYVKYSALLLLAVLFVWSIADLQARQCYHRRGLWIALAVFVVLVLPQVHTLWQLDFSPFKFAVGRAKEADTIAHHLLYPLRFILAQCAALLFAVVLCRVALSSSFHCSPPSSFHCSSGLNTQIVWDLVCGFSMVARAGGVFWGIMFELFQTRRQNEQKNAARNVSRKCTNTAKLPPENNAGFVLVAGCLPRRKTPARNNTNITKRFCVG